MFFKILTYKMEITSQSIIEWGIMHMCICAHACVNISSFFLLFMLASASKPTPQICIASTAIYSTTLQHVFVSFILMMVLFLFVRFCFLRPPHFSMPGIQCSQTWPRHCAQLVPQRHEPFKPDTSRQHAINC